MRVWKKFPICWRCDFFDSAQTRIASSENGFVYDGSVSGSIIYTYVNGNPLSYSDRFGLSPAPVVPNPNGVVPGGPWSSAGSGQLPGDFFGPKKPSGGKDMCRYVPPKGDQEGYWKTNNAGEKGWNRFNLSGDPISPEQAHPGNGSPAAPPPSGWMRIGVGIGLMLYSGDAN